MPPSWALQPCPGSSEVVWCCCSRELSVMTGSYRPTDRPSRRKLVAYLNSSLNFPLKNVYFYQGMMPVSKVKPLLAFVSICVCNAQCKLEIPIVLHGTWSVGLLIRSHLHPWLTSLNWKYRKIDKWYTNRITVNCCQINCQADNISTRSTFHPFLMIR